MLFNSNRKRRYQDAQRDKLIKIQLSTRRNTVVEDITQPQEPDKGQGTDLPTEFDEHGAELHRDARVWKVYVDEADKYDKELVDGWNASMDVLLIFAALFSAISTAFLIESSKMLQPDPAELSSRALSAISHTLDTVVNGTQQPGSLTQSSNNDAEFTPSQAAIYINVLWYLSLSLSLATSFISILAKDWCHSFITGRTGHPFSQTCHRQNKWNMIERWRLSELLSVLPALLHLALLCFSVGLCLYLWDTHIAVAIPVICITGATVAFYVLSSAAATLLDYFPYTTTISRMCRSNAARRSFEIVHVLASRLVAYPLVQFVWLLVANFVSWVLVVIEYCLLILAISCHPFLRIKKPLDFLQTSADNSPLLVQLVATPVLSIVRLVIWYPSQVVVTCLEELAKFCLKTISWIAFYSPQANDITCWKRPRKPLPQDYSARDGATISLALSWLITNSEIPESIETALQSIAGATQEVPRQPLLDCGATLEILRRLASANLYKGRGTEAHTSVSRYSRALVFLGGAAGLGPDTVQAKQGDGLEGVIWDLHLAVENKVATLVVNGSFWLTQTNINAFRLGNTAAASALQTLRKGNDSEDTRLEETVGSISELLRLHLSDNRTLHNSALLSLVNAAALLHLVTLGSPATLDLPLSLVTLVESSHNYFTPHGKLVIALAVMWALSCNKFANQGDIIQPANRPYLKEAVRALVELHSQNEIGLDLIIAFGLKALAIDWEVVTPDDTTSQMQETFYQEATSRVNAFFDGFSKAVPYIPSSYVPTPDFEHDVVLSYLRAFDGTCDLGPFGAALSCIPFFTLTYFCNLSSNNPFVDNYIKPTLGRWPFPRLSAMLVWIIEEREFIPLLEEKSNSEYWTEKFVATGQLWLLFTLYQYSTDGTPDDREKLGVQLRKYRASNPLETESRHRELGEQLVRCWNSRRLYYSPPGVWSCRLMECVFQFQKTQAPSSVYEYLQNTPQHLRGLSSFTTCGSQSPQLTGTGGLKAEPEAQDLRMTHTSTDGTNLASKIVPATHSSNLAPGVDVTTVKGEGENKYTDAGGDNGDLHGRVETGTFGREMPLEQHGATNEENSRAPDELGVGPVDVGQTESNSPYTAIDMRSSRDVPE